MKPLLLLTSIFFSAVLFGQNGMPLPASARGMAMGQTGVSVQDINSIFSNPAGLAFVSGTQFAAFGEQRFAGSGINNFAIGAGHQLGSGTFGLSVQSFGAESYSEQKVALAYARKLFDKLSIGVQFDYLNTSIDEYGSTGAITFDIGFMAPLNDEISVGVRAFSPVRVALTEQEDLPGLLGVGFSYHPSKKVSVDAEVEKAVDTDLAVRAGLEYWVHPKLAIRAGGAANPTLATFGVGLRLNEQFKIDLASSWHQVLGISPGLGLRYELK